MALNADEKRAIRSAYDRGTRVSTLAKRYGVSEDVILRLIRPNGMGSVQFRGLTRFTRMAGDIVLKDTGVVALPNIPGATPRQKSTPNDSYTDKGRRLRSAPTSPLPSSRNQLMTHIRKAMHERVSIKSSDAPVSPASAPATTTTSATHQNTEQELIRQIRLLSTQLEIELQEQQATLESIERTLTSWS